MERRQLRELTCALSPSSVGVCLSSANTAVGDSTGLHRPWRCPTSAGSAIEGTAHRKPGVERFGQSGTVEDSTRGSDSSVGTALELGAVKSFYLSDEEIFESSNGCRNPSGSWDST